MQHYNHDANRTPRSRIAFDAARLHTAEAAIIDLTDPLRTNVQFTLDRHVMYADLVSLRTMAEEEADTSGVAKSVVDAWEKVLGGKTRGSNFVTEIMPGVILIPLLGAMAEKARPAGLNYMN